MLRVIVDSNGEAAVTTVVPLSQATDLCPLFTAPDIYRFTSVTLSGEQRTYW